MADETLLATMTAMGAAAPLDPARIERLIDALSKAREKLQLYRNAHGPDYVGGMEYTALMSLIELALADAGCAEQLAQPARAF